MKGWGGGPTCCHNIAQRVFIHALVLPFWLKLEPKGSFPTCLPTLPHLTSASLRWSVGKFRKHPWEFFLSHPARGGPGPGRLPWVSRVRNDDEHVPVYKVDGAGGLSLPPQADRVTLTFDVGLRSHGTNAWTPYHERHTWFPSFTLCCTGPLVQYSIM